MASKKAVAKDKDPGTFAGFPDDTLGFLRDLAANQNREWFEENRHRYLEAFKAPIESYVVASTKAMRKARIPIFGDPRRSTFRLHRDVRFSKDKRPYKTNGGCVLSPSGEKNSPGMVYTHISPEGGFFAAGFYRPEAAQLLALRQAIADKPAAFLAVDKKLKAKGLEISGIEVLKRTPPAFKGVDERVEPFIRMKSFIARRDYDDALMRDGEKMITALEEFTLDAMPLLAFGWDALGVMR